MRVFTATIGTETNTFAPLPTALRDFELERNDPAGRDDAHLHGFAAVMRVVREQAVQSGWTVFEGPIGFAMPGGTTTRSAYERLRELTTTALRAAMPVDMVLLGLHGAMVADGYPDAEGDLLAHIRSFVGPNCAIGAELDPHCHLTELKCRSADILVCFKEYPHTDILERAREVVALTVQTQAGKIKPVKSLYELNMMAVYHTSRAPMRAFVDRMQALEGKDGVLSISLSHGFPWGDVPEFGSRMLVITDDHAAQGDTMARELGEQLIACRDQLSPGYPSVDVALDQARAYWASTPSGDPTHGIAHGPIVFADTADNTGGGAPGDSTFILRRLIERDIGNVLIGPLWDPMAVRICFAAGDGARLPLRIGGKTGPTSGEPVDTTVTVLKVIENCPMLEPFGRKDTSWSIGDAAMVQIDTANGPIRIVLNSERNQALGDLFTPFGVDWKSAALVVLKSSQHFYAVYGPSARAVIYVDTPGSMPTDLSTLPFRHKKTGLWPFSD